MWPFKSEPLVDTTESIIMGEKIFYLDVDPEQYSQAVAFILERFRLFIYTDLRMGRETNQSPDHLISTILKNLDVKYLANAFNLEILTNAFKDTAVSKSGTRFLDTILYINLNIPTEILEAISGKFLKGVLYGLTESQYELFPLPEKDQWQEALIAFPWIPLLPFFQSVYDEDELSSQLQRDYTQLSQVVQPTMIQGGTR